jgi:intein-encoded DNA endonuclease-like protein
VYGYQIADIIIFCESAKNRNKIIKIVCLEGLVISKIGNLSIEISHRSEYYKNCVMSFKKGDEF